MRVNDLTDPNQVYILWFSNFHGDDELVGIYRTEEAATKQKEKYDRMDRRSLRVEPYQLDG